MSDVKVVRGISEESEDSEDIFASNFGASTSVNKVKIVGSDNHFERQAAAIDAAKRDASNRGEEKSDPVKDYRGEEARSAVVTANNHRNHAPRGPQVPCATTTNAAAAPAAAPSQSAAPRCINRNPLLQKSYSQASPGGGCEARQGRPADEYYSSPEEAEEGTGGDVFIEVSLAEPHKVGDGISSYLAYKMTTRTNLNYFKREDFSVTRRFSDFLGLHEKLSEKYLSRGRVIPPAPEKSIVGSTKVKMSSGSSEAQQQSQSFSAGHSGASAGGSPSSGGDANSNTEFTARRRYALERFINRVAAHPVLRRDHLFIEFLESVRELPRATSTSALSTASVFRLLGRVNDTVNKITYKMEENDPWYEEKTRQIENTEAQLKRLCGLAESLAQCRSDLASATGAFSQGAAMLSSAEEAHSLSRALAHLARVEEKVERVHIAESEADHIHLVELLKDYVGLVGAVKDVLAERAKAFQNWRHAQSMVAKKKEQRARLEMSGRADKMPAANEEVTEWEMRLDENQETFNRISKTIKGEVELFEQYRVKDFKVAIIKYLEALMVCQLQMVKNWEEFLPEVKSILY